MDRSGLAAGADRSGPLARARENLAGIVSVAVTGVWLAALVTDQDWWLAALLVGYVVVVPVTAILFEEEEERADDPATGSREGETTEDALQTLRERYARGELTDEQFERKLDRLLETETVEDAEDRARERETER